MELKDESSELFCSDSASSHVDIKGKAAAIARGNCTFSTKAFLVQKYGGDMALIISKTGLVRLLVLSN